MGTLRPTPGGGRLGTEGLRTRSAFSLVEVLVAVAIVGVVFFSLYSGITAGFTVIRMARENLRATQILAEKMETIRLYTWDQINSNGFIPLSFTAPFYALDNQTNTPGLTYTGMLSVVSAPIAEAYSNDVKLVTVQVLWNSGNRLRTRTMSTFVSRYGLQNYIY